MADNTRATWDPFLYELRGKVQEQFPTEAVFLSQLSGVGDPTKVGRFTRDMDTNRDIFSGRQVRHTLILAGLPGGGYVSESGTWNVPHELPSKEVHIKLARALVPFSVTVDVERDSLDNSSASAVATLVKQARIALARITNAAFLGNGDAKVSDITGGSSPGLTITVGTAANFDVLLPGTVWDILTKSNGADPGQGKRRKIDSVNEAAGTVTFSTTQQASDGGSGNITFTTAEGIFITGSYGQAAQGLEQAVAATGTFQDVDKATTPQWQGTDGRGGDGTTKALSTPMLNGAVRRGRRAGLGVWDYGLGDPAAIDLFKDSLLAQGQYDMQDMELKSGFSGIRYSGADRPFPLIKEPMMKKAAVRLITDEAFQLYGDQKGPDFLDDDGGMFRRFARSLPKEAELLDRHQLGVVSCNKLVRIDNLEVAA